MIRTAVGSHEMHTFLKYIATTTRKGPMKWNASTQNVEYSPVGLCAYTIYRVILINSMSDLNKTATND